MDHKGNPLKYRRLKLRPHGPVVRTDKHGAFVFQGIQITKYDYLTTGLRSFPILPNTVQINCRLIKNRFENENQNSGISGKIFDTDTVVGALHGALITLKQGEREIKKMVTDVDGRFSVAVDSGFYDLEVTYTGYSPKIINNIFVVPDYTTYIDLEVKSNAFLTDFDYHNNFPPIIRQDETSTGTTYFSYQIYPTSLLPTPVKLPEKRQYSLQIYLSIKN